MLNNFVCTGQFFCNTCENIKKCFFTLQMPLDALCELLTVNIFYHFELFDQCNVFVLVKCAVATFLTKAALHPCNSFELNVFREGFWMTRGQNCYPSAYYSWTNHLQAVFIDRSQSSNKYFLMCTRWLYRHEKLTKIEVCRAVQNESNYINLTCSDRLVKN